MEESHQDFEQLYHIYSDDVYRFILMKIGDRQSAEDLTQDTFIRAYKNFHEFQHKSSVKTWLFSISRNITIDFYRSNKKIFSLPDWFGFETEQTVTTPADIIELGEEIELLYRTIKKLKKNYQEVLILRKIQEFSIEETAEILQCSASKVKSTTHRAMVALKKELVKGGHFDEQEVQSREA